MSSGAPESQGLVDYLFICGLDTQIGLDLYEFSSDDCQRGRCLCLPPLERPYKARVVQHFPEHSNGVPFEGEAIATMCMPHGLQLCTQKQVTGPVNHSFVITREDGTRLYGVSVLFYEEVQHSAVREAITALQKMYEMEHRLDFETPEGSEKFDSVSLTSFNAYCQNADRLYAQKAIGVLTRTPFVHSLEGWLYDIWCAVQLPEAPPLPLESYIYNLLFEVPLPPQGKSIGFSGVYRTHHCRRPGTPELPLFELSLRDLLGVLGLENLIRLYSCLLLEYRIVLFSQDYRLLMLVSEGVTNLLFPFAWPHVYVPILPLAATHFLDAPLPYIMGLKISEPKDADIQLASEANVCYVHIDEQTVVTSDDVPIFPNADELRKEITDVLVRYATPTVPEPSPTVNQSASPPEEVNNGMPSPAGGLEDSVEQGLKGMERSRSCDTDSGLGGLLEQATSTPIPKNAGASAGLSPSLDTSSRVPWRRPHPSLPPAGCASSTTSLNVLQRSETYNRVAQLARDAGVSLDDLSHSLDTRLSLAGSSWDASFVGQTDIQQYVEMLKFNNALREIFLDHFVNIFFDYETFLIRAKAAEMSNYLAQKEAVHTFDKASFLGDQRETSLPFLSAFLETQMFANFVDLKLLSTWEDPDPILVIFEQRLRTKHQHQLQMEYDAAAGHTKHPYCIYYNKDLEAQLNRMVEPDNVYLTTRPHEVQHTSLPSWGTGSNPQTPSQRAHVQGQFPTLQANILRQRPTNMGASTPSQQIARMGRKDRHRQRCQHVKISEKPEDREKYLQEARRQTRQPNLSDMAPSVMAQTNWRFVDTLLKECKAKTKRMVVDKMGQEAIELGHGDLSVSGVEENTLVTGLCDLLERIWSHGPCAKHVTGQGKSALWSHLLKFLERETNPAVAKAAVKEERKLSTTGEGGFDSPESVRLDIYSSLKRVRRGVGPGPSLGGSSKGLDLLAVFGPARRSLITDIRTVQSMHGIKTDVGFARAFVRLTLEKKLLNAHLRKLLTDKQLLRDLYRRFAFLRCEEEREQFLFHLLALNAVDYFSFTNTFTQSPVVYRVFIYSGRKYSGHSTTANAWFCLHGQHRDTSVKPIPRMHMQFEFEHQNLGMLTTMRIGHDNSGISPKWFIEFILVQNTITGHIYRFPCNRWLGKGVDDGSIERLLVGELLRISEDEAYVSTESSTATTGAHLGYQTPPRCRSPSVSRRNSDAKNMTLPMLQEQLGNAVNSLVKHFYKPDKERTNLTVILCGELGLVPSMELVFNYGFRSSRLFQKKIYVWDYLEKVATMYLSQWDRVHAEDAKRLAAITQLCRQINKISQSNQSIGKDGKFQRWVCIGLRDHALPDWMHVLASSPITCQLYEERSFLRDEQLRAFVANILESLSEFSILLEPALVSDLNPQMTTTLATSASQ